MNRRQIAALVARLKKDIGVQQEIGRRLAQGRAVFANGNASRVVPEMFSYQGKYLLPEAVPWLTDGLEPAYLDQSLQTRSWYEAVRKWNAPHFSPAGLNEVDRDLEEIPYNIANDQRSLDYIKWIQAQPLTTQFALDAIMPAQALVWVAMAIIPTNLGWLLWIFTRAMGRWIRRLRYPGMSV